MAEAKIDFIIDGGKAVNTLGELETKASQLREELNAQQIGSKRFKELNQELVQTTKQVKNLELGFESLDNEQIAGELGSVAGAVGDITASMVLLGGENESIEKMASNIQSALGISMAFKGAIEGASSAMKLFNNVIRANPIGLLVTGIALLIAGVIALVKYFDEVKKFFVWLADVAIGMLSDLLLWMGLIDEGIETQLSLEQKAHDERMKQKKEITDAHKKRLDEIKAERESQRELFEDGQTQFDLNIERMEAEGKNADALRVAKQEAVIKEIQDQLTAIDKIRESWTKYYEDQAIAQGKSREEYIEILKGQGIDIEALQTQLADKQEELDNKLFSNKSKLINLERGIREKGAKDAVKIEEDKTNEIILINEGYIKFLEEKEGLENEYLKSKLSAEQQELDAVRNKYADMIMEAEMFGEDTAILEEAQAQRIKDINDKYRKLEADAQKQADKDAEDLHAEHVEVLKQGARDLFNVANQFAEHLSARDLKRAQEKTARGEALTANEIKRLQRQDKVNKAFALAQIASDTARGISGAIASGAGVPFPFNLGAIASGIAAVLSGALQASKVLGESVDIPTPSSTSASVEESDNDAQRTPQLDPLGFGSTLLNQPSRVYVVESDITSTQKKVNVLEEQATFG